MAIGGMKDHIHILLSMHPSEGISTLLQNVKAQASKWMHETKGIEDFAWQAGYAAFSYSKSQLPQVIKYISNQKKHHQLHSFDDEMLRIANNSGINFQSEYLLKGID